MVYASFLLLLLQPDLLAVLTQKKVVRAAEGDLRSLAFLGKPCHSLKGTKSRYFLIQML